MSRKSTNCRRVNCIRTEAECHYAHSIHEWKPINSMCKLGEDCRYKEMSCYFRHDYSFAQKLRLADYYGLTFHIKPVPMPEVPIPVVVEEEKIYPMPVVVEVPMPIEDPLYMLQIEKASIQSEIELISLMKKNIELRMSVFKMKASDVWEVGSDELEFKL